MSKSKGEVTPVPQAVVATRREEVASQLRELQGAVRTDLGWAPRSLPWVLPAVAAATGLAVGLALRRRLRGGARRRPRPPAW
jgi:hypothetical protein